ncbi:MAG: glycosyltransferase family 39 protein [Jaaginema sp. PMC 1079.18]|nr:glycosyltransferase family 39 protein [Jaaginema sp. PMC 1080.18]MEC4853311.1 glycosyltransferase family 39 protein [Jaaginema sp. PMC 1079.18]MEC4868544.1 glycosyltransferase family 39 protein [Jaaginema sp. PMC 1078.18]
MKKATIFESERSRSELYWIIGLFGAAIALWTVALGNVPLRDWDEGSHAIVARELYRQGNWIYLTFFGQPYFMKPPLGYWLVAGSYHLFEEVNEWTTRFPVAMVTACGVPLLYFVAREVFQHRRPALFAAGTYLTLLPVVRHGRLLMLDGIVNTFLIVLLLCLLRSRKAPFWAVGVGMSAAAIALTKGVLVLALGTVVLFFVLCDRRWYVFRNPYTWLGLFLGLTVVLGWYYAQWSKYGDIFIQTHLGTQNFDRLHTAVEGNDGPPWYYVLELLKYGFPWLLFLPYGLLLAMRSAYHSWGKASESWGNLVLSGFLVFFTTISLMGTKLPWYVMPLYPFLALAVGAALYQITQNQRFFSVFYVTFLLLFTVAGVGGIGYFLMVDTQPLLVIMSGVIVLTFSIAAWQYYRCDRHFIRSLFIGLYLALLLLMLSPLWNWELNEQFPVVAVGQLIRKHTPPGQIIYTSFAYNRPSLDFYSDRQVYPADVNTLQQRRATQHYLLLDSETLTQLQIPPSEIIDTVTNFSLVKPST